ncbi:hypothetical protein PTSG_01618 [Salpingoeca rosetta]|uniref:Uncharacterized protein n=1 Tax=Salpingoeca rosetta (strain ATCC 50818 / BSB-021) TaxID=946362 RepID=F2TYG6_SALR5|nr:uncharacterized protein PTSG_01618 [Salpingoeca rosetta]EGD78640.1 hypothetical protein PTSG_01618 [Salpingoeca rosetta]|eukprot:XP_004997598.1 hypothetical protein PTSG_01618 [Salpingoeca rosetta]
MVRGGVFVFVGAVALLLQLLLAPSCHAVDCSSRTKDYCEVETTCIWDQQQAACRAVDCRDYRDHSSCKADPKDVGPCAYQWELRVCYQKNGQVPCTEYYEDCPSDRCQYDKEQGYCYGAHDQLPCFLMFDEAACSKAGSRCTYTNNACMSKAEAEACSSQFDKSKCTGKCKWHQDDMLCFPKDLTVPCKLLRTNETCDTNRCTKYNTGTQAIMCLPKDAQPQCDMFSSADLCPDQRCQWNQGAQRCFDPKVGMDCEFYFDMQRCPQDRCRVVGGMCLDKEQPIDCSMFYYANDDCNKDNGCRPDCDAKECTSCPASGKCDDTKCPDATPEPLHQCSDHVTEGECRSDSVCKWDDSVKACVDGDVGTPCSDYVEPSQCQNARDCAWDQGECVECKNGDCKLVTTTTTPDAGDACDTYTQDTCPYPRCFFSQQGVSAGKCRDSQCRDLVDENFCKAHGGCTFDKNVYACYKTSEGPPCNLYSDKDMCNSLANCKWDADNLYCAGKDTGKACTSYSVNNCPARCVTHFDTNTCESKACSDITDQDACKDAGCTFDANMYLCYNDTGLACNKYTSFPTCPPNRCNYDYDDAHPKGVCKEKACGDLYDKEECLAVKGCKFVESINLCYKDTGKPCDKYTDRANCPLNRCSWSDDGTGNTVCQPKVCTEYLDKSLCTAANCIWNAHASSCYNDTHKSCDKYTERTCPPNRCVYDYDFGYCRTYDCPDYTDPDDCNSSGKGCVFNTTFGVCVTKGEPIPCSVFNFNQPGCPTSYCKYATDVNVCYPKDGQVPCSYIYDLSACDKRSHCTWDSAFNRCEGKPKNQQRIPNFLKSFN